METTIKRDGERLFTAEYGLHVRREMERGNFDYVRGFLTTILSYIRQHGVVRITDSKRDREWTLRGEQELDAFLDDLNSAYAVTGGIRFEQQGEVIHAVRLDDDEALFKPLTEAIVDEAKPEAVILFGSRAGGAGRPGSDVDLLVVLSDEHEERRSRRGLTGRIQRRLAGTPVGADILVYTRSEVEHWRNVPGHIIATSLEYGRPLYGRV